MPENPPDITESRRGEDIGALEQRFAQAQAGPDKVSVGLALAQCLADHGAYPRAIQVLEQVKPLAASGDDQVMVLQQLGSLHLRLSQYDKAYLYLGEALTLLSSQPNSVELFQVYYDIAWMCFRQGLLDNARTYADGARQVLDGIEGHAEAPKLRAQLLHIAALIDAASGNLDSAIAGLEQEAAYQKEIGDGHRLAAVFNKLASLHYTKGDILEALEYQNQTHELSNKLNDNFRLALSHKNFGDINYILGDLDSSLEHFQKSLEICLSIDNGLGQVFAEAGIGKVRCCQGDFIQAKRLLDQALARARELGNRDREACVLRDLAELACCQGRPEQALGCLDMAGNLDSERSQPVSPRWTLIRARARLLEKDLQGAIEAQKAVENIRTSPLRIDDEEMVAIPELEAEADFLLAKAHQRQGHGGLAAQAVARAAETFGSFYGPLEPWMRERFLWKRAVVEIYQLQEQLKG